MALRFPYSPDWGATRDIEPRVLSARFGDGYEQRVADGINTRLRKWSLRFSAASEAKRRAIEGFLEYHDGRTAFEYASPDERATLVKHGFAVHASPGDNTYALVYTDLAAAYPNGWVGPGKVPGPLDPFSTVVEMAAAPQVYADGVLLTGGGVQYLQFGATDPATGNFAPDPNYGIPVLSISVTDAVANGAKLSFSGTVVPVRKVICRRWRTASVGYGSSEVSADFEEVPL